VSTRSIIAFSICIACGTAFAELPDAWCVLKETEPREALTKAEIQCGADSLELVAPLVEFGKAKLLVADMDEALVAFQEALRINAAPIKTAGTGANSVLQKRLTRRVTILNWIARLQLAKREYVNAAETARKALNTAQLSMSPSDEQVKIARVCQSIAVSYSYPLVQQLDLLHQILTSTQRALGTSHESVALVLDELILLAVLEEDKQQALSLCTLAVGVRRKALGNLHPEVANALNKQASLYYDMGETEKALHPLQEALRIRQKAFGKGHPLVTKSIENLARVYRDLKNKDLEDRLMEKGE